MKKFLMPIIGLLVVLSCGQKSRSSSDNDEEEEEVREELVLKTCTFSDTLGISHVDVKIDYPVKGETKLVDAANKDRMLALLRDFARPLLPEGVRCGQFLVAACASSEYKEKDGERVLTGWDAHRPGVELRLDYQLPAAWPDDWAPGAWQFPEIDPQLSLVRPPRQVNLDAVFEFVVEGIEL